MSLIYMQSTIDYFYEADARLLEDVKEDTIKYYKFKL